MGTDVISATVDGGAWRTGQQVGVGLEYPNSVLGEGKPSKL